MGISGIHAAVVVVVVVVGGVVGASAVADLGSSDELVTVEETEAVKSNASDVAFEVRTALNNTGTADVTRSFELVVEDEDGSSVTVDERTVTLPAGETRGLTLSAPTDALTSGQYDYTLGDDTGPLATGTITLDRPAFVVSDARADSVVHGEPGTVTASVRNRGDFRGLRNVDLLLDRNQDGAYDAGETIATRAPTLRAGSDAVVMFPVETDGLEPGTYAYRVEATESAREGTLVVHRPAAVRIAGSTMTADAVRGDRFNGSVTLRNAGDVPGNETVRLDGPTEAFDWNQTVTLDGNETRTLDFDGATANLTRGNYSVAVSTSNDSASTMLRVRESFLKIDELNGPQSADVDDDIRFSARVRNLGDAAANESVELRIDLDGDDDPETVTANRSVTLEPGEETTVEFAIDADDRDRFTDEDLLGTHVYGVYGRDANATDVVVVREYHSGGGSSAPPSSSPSEGDGTDEPEIVSKDVITQEKYGLDYEAVSGETREQVDELHERQPFADGLVVTEVLTREEIARREYGLDVKRNDNFNFSSIEMEYQQKIEAEFDAQFESDDGDRIDSWDELAREQFGSEYDSLNESRQEAIRERYLDQFDG